MRTRRASSIVAVASAVIALGMMAREARAQAWVGDQGALDLSLDYNFGTSSKVVTDTDEEFKDAGTTTHQLTLGAEYVPIAKLAATVSLPLAFLKYTGDKTLYPHPGGGSYDDGDTHATLTDLRAGVRYQLLEEPVALSPHLAVSIPVADYETVGNTVAGRHLMALHAGLGIGRLITDAAYVHVLYEFSLVEKYDQTAGTKKHGQNHSDIALTLGYKLLDQQLDIHLDGNARITHGGVKFSEFNTLPADEQMYHDAILKEDIYLVGGGVGYQISNALALSLSARLFVAGSNTQNASVVALGATWSPL